MKISKTNIVLADRVVYTGLEIENGVIIHIGDVKDGLDLSDYYVVPGFIDQHIHGSDNSDAMDGSQEALDRMAKSLLKEGTTSFLPTTMTGAFEQVDQALSAIKNYRQGAGANVLGAHLEGPFINKTRVGAQPIEFVQAPSVEAFKRFKDHDVIKLITLAPEVDGADDLIQYCKDNNVVVSIGHTSAKFREVKHALEIGANQFTHAYNAMTPLHHRDIGVVGAMYLLDGLRAELICDGIHSSKEAVELLYKNKGRDGIILITDSMRAKYLKDGLSELGGQEVFVKEGKATLKDGTIAGSILRMNVGVRNMMDYCNIPIYDAVYMASSVPAINLGIKNKGFIKEGFDADLAVLDKNLEVVMTIVGGKIKYERE